MNFVPITLSSDSSTGSSFFGLTDGISFISGFTLDELVKTKKINIISLVLFCFGFSLVFIILGASASAIGKFFLYNTNYFRIIAGLVIIIFSLQLLGIINIKYFNFEKKYYTKKPSNRIFLWKYFYSIYYFFIFVVILYYIN